MLTAKNASKFVRLIKFYYKWVAANSFGAEPLDFLGDFEKDLGI